MKLKLILITFLSALPFALLADEAEELHPLVNVSAGDFLVVCEDPDQWPQGLTHDEKIVMGMLLAYIEEQEQAGVSFENMTAEQLVTNFEAFIMAEETSAPELDADEDVTSSATAGLGSGIANKTRGKIAIGRGTRGLWNKFRTLF